VTGGVVGAVLWSSWDADHPYRLRLCLRPGRVTAKVRDPTRDQIIFRQERRLAADAVHSGRADLLIRAASASFDNLQVTTPP
jgi:hypothetical protein